MKKKEQTMKKKELHRRAHAIAGFALTALVATALTGCRWGQGTDDTPDNDSIAWCTVEYEDSVSLLAATAYQQMRVDFPEIADTAEADAATLAAVAWMRQEIQVRSYPNMYDGEDGDVPPAPQLPAEAATADPATFLQACGQMGLAQMQQELKDWGDGYGGGITNGLYIELLARNAHYITLSLGHETYMGGAHGSYYSECVTFRRTDGQRMGWNIFDMSRKAEIVALIKEGLKEYFNGMLTEMEDELGENKEIETDEELYEWLMLWDDPETPENELEYGIPLPATEPWVTPNGISLIYQQYEIAAYSVGMPNVCIPVEKAKRVLSAEGKALVGLR